MSNYSIKKKNKAINIKNLIFPKQDENKYKFKNLKLSSLNKLNNAYEGELTDRTHRKSSKLNQSELCKTIRNYTSKAISKLIFKCDNNNIKSNSLKKRKKFSNTKKGDNSLNTIKRTYMELKQIKNKLLEYSDIKPKKQKFIHIYNKSMNKDKIFKKFFQKSNNSLIKNLSRNNNILNININNNSFKTNISNTFNENEINNYTQRNTYFENNQKLIPLFSRKIKDKYLNISKNNNLRNIDELIFGNCLRKRNINPKIKANLNIFRTYNDENRINTINNENTNIIKKKKIHLLMKNREKSLSKTLPYRDKLLNDLKKNNNLKSKFKINKLNQKHINLVKKEIKLNNSINSNINTNFINSLNNPKIITDKKIKIKSISKKVINAKNILNKNGALIKTKKLIFSQTPQKTKENTITIKDTILKKVSKIDSCTLGGYTSSGEKKINQDNFFIEKNFLDEKDQFFIGICDGHGEQGHLISSYISKCLPNFLADTSDKNIISSFNSLNQNIVENSKIDCTLSGSTCTSIILNQEKIICINLGDSRTVLARYENGKYTAINLSNDHKPNLKGEKKRILLNGGRIKPFYDEKTKKFLGPDRIWIKEDDLPGLAMTRSFGDIIAHSVGVISEPEIKRYEFNGNEKFIVLASDGIWEYISSEECVDIIKNYYENNMDAIGAIHYIMKEAFNRWKKFDEIIDDITIIVIFFDSK